MYGEYTGNYKITKCSCNNPQMVTSCSDANVQKCISCGKEYDTISSRYPKFQRHDLLFCKCRFPNVMETRREIEFCLSCGKRVSNHMADHTRTMDRVCMIN